MSSTPDSATFRALELARSLAESFAARGQSLYLVGGAVRDMLLGRTDLDLDFATSSRPETTLSILHDLDLGRPYTVGERFGTIGVDVRGRSVEITTYRSREVYALGSRKPVVEFGRTLEDDLSRRDFTVNAIAFDPLTGEVLDPLDGHRDLDTGTIRAVGSPEDRFKEDPLRMLRAIRFAARLDFEVEPKTWAGILAAAGSLQQISRERVRDEYTAILTGPNPSRGLKMLRDAGLLEASVPELLELTRMPDHGPRHPLSLWDHTMSVVSAVPPRPEIRWAALLHDIAKPSTRTHDPSGRPRFFHHEEIGAQIARTVLKGLRYSNSLVDDVSTLVETHMQLHSYSAEWSDGAVRRLILRLGPLLEDAILLARADAAGHSLGPRPRRSSKFDELERRLADLREAQAEPLKSPLSGHDLMERYDRPPGPWIGLLKQALEDAVVEGNLSAGDREGAWQIADRLIGQAG